MAPPKYAGPSDVNRHDDMRSMMQPGSRTLRSGRRKLESAIFDSADRVFEPGGFPHDLEAGLHIDAAHVLDDWRWNGEHWSQGRPEDAPVPRKDLADLLAQASSSSGVGALHVGSGVRAIAPKQKPRRRARQPQPLMLGIISGNRQNAEMKPQPTRASDSA